MCPQCQKLFCFVPAALELSLPPKGLLILLSEETAAVVTALPSDAESSQHNCFCSLICNSQHRKMQEMLSAVLKNWLPKKQCRTATEPGRTMQSGQEIPKAKQELQEFEPKRAGCMTCHEGSNSPVVGRKFMQQCCQHLGKNCRNEIVENCAVSNEQMQRNLVGINLQL